MSLSWRTYLFLQEFSSGSGSGLIKERLVISMNLSIPFLVFASTVFEIEKSCSKTPTLPEFV